MAGRPNSTVMLWQATLAFIRLRFRLSTKRAMHLLYQQVQSPAVWSHLQEVALGRLAMAQPSLKATHDVQALQQVGNWLGVALVNMSSTSGMRLTLHPTQGADR